MSNRPNRGRAVGKTARRSLSGFYILIGAVVVLVLGGLAVFALQGNQSASAPAPTPAGPTPPPPDVPNGRTEDGYYYLGEASAPIVVTEFGDFQ